MGAGPAGGRPPNPAPARRHPHYAARKTDPAPVRRHTLDQHAPLCRALLDTSVLTTDINAATRRPAASSFVAGAQAGTVRCLIPLHVAQENGQVFGAIRPPARSEQQQDHDAVPAGDRPRQRAAADEQSGPGRPRAGSGPRRADRDSGKRERRRADGLAANASAADVLPADQALPTVEWRKLTDRLTSRRATPTKERRCPGQAPGADSASDPSAPSRSRSACSPRPPPPAAPPPQPPRRYGR
nr:hypothetical protein KitaXyl93_75540 [Kitasatospora sp. Xyl93]